MNIFGPSLDHLLAEGKIKVPDSWPTDDLIPLPKDKILVGTNVQPRNVEITRWRKEGAAQMMYLNDFKRDFGLLPALSAYGPGQFAFYNDFFYDEKHDTLNKNGVIPVVRYETRPFNGFKEIIKGKHDDTFKNLGEAIARNGVPFVMIPYQLPNEGSASNYKHGAGTGWNYIDAYIRMHDIFESEGANENTIWSVKLRLGRWSNTKYQNPFSYIPPSEYIDWIGWSVNDHNIPIVGLDSHSFEHIIGSTHDRAAVLYPDKPQFLWELSTRSTKNQHKWIDDALTVMPTYPWLKGFIFDVMPFQSKYNSVYNFNPIFTEKSKDVIRKHMNSGKFAGAYTDGSITLSTHRTVGNKWKF